MKDSLNDVLKGLKPVIEKKEVTKEDPLVKVWEGPKSIDYPEQGIRGAYNFSTAVKLDKVPNDPKIVDSLWKLGPGKRVKAGKVYLELSKHNDKLMKEDTPSAIISEKVTFDQVDALNKGREGKEVIAINGNEIKGSVYLGAGTMIIKERDGSTRISAMNPFTDETVTIILSKDQAKNLKRFK